MYQQITIKTLKHQGKTNGEIARIMNVHRNTVSNVLRRKEVVEKQVRIKPSSFSTYQSQIEQLFNKGISKLRIWQILKDEYGVQRGYSSFTKYARKHLTKAQPAYIVQNTPPGEEAEVDFGFAGLVPATEGNRIKVWIFVMTLSYSRLGFYAAVTDQSIETFIQCHLDAFTFFGGVPKSVKIDNLKAAVLKNQRYDLEVNKTFLEFSSHHRFVIKPCTPHEPQQKGKVESGVGYVKKNFLAGRSFTSIEDLRSQLKQWMVSTANARVHGTTKQVPTELFNATEKQYLLSLPESPFSLESPLVRLVKLNCHINFQNNYYSVPARFVNERVDVRRKGNLLIISSHDQEIATHVIATGIGKYITNPTHFPPDRVYSATSYQAKYEEKMKAIGPAAHEYFKQLILRDHLWLRVVKKIMGLALEFGHTKVDRALKRALIFNAFKPSTIERILKDNLQDLEIEPTLIQGKSTQEELTSGSQKEEIKEAEQKQPEETLARDLAYYTKKNNGDEKKGT